MAKYTTRMKKCQAPERQNVKNFSHMPEKRPEAAEWKEGALQRSFKVPRAERARIPATIQKRTTIWVSVQPRCSKWW